MDDLEPYIARRTGSTDLVVVLHGFGNRSDRLAQVREVIAHHDPQADVYAPLLAISDFTSTEPAEEIVAQVVYAIDRLYAARPRAQTYRSITLVGHSIGAVFARKIAILAHGEQADKRGIIAAPFEFRLRDFVLPRAWAPSLRRIVLLAGMNRGWSVTSGRDWWTSAKFSLGQWLGELCRGMATIFAIRRGAPFLVQTRLQWLALMNTEYGGRPDLTLVQLLGSIDDAVAPDDSLDFSIDGVNQTRQSTGYNYLEVRQSGHDNIVEMSERGPANTAGARAERRAKFLIAYQADAAQLSALRIERAHMDDTMPAPPDPAVEHVVFVVHGIRDKGFWTKKIARTIKREAGTIRFESWTQSYGYFAMLPFLLRSVRQRKVEWLMDCYCEARARYPNAEFHYVGHSNGTYLAARALELYPAARFSRIVFAGSVVRRDYDWSTLVRAGRVKQVLNYVATKDWVVALFPKGVQRLRSFDLGSAGHDGFQDEHVHDINFIDGAHGVGHEEATWDDIARFIVHGVTPKVVCPPFRTEQFRLLRMAGYISGIFLLAIASLLLAIAAGLGAGLFAAQTPAQGALLTIGIVGYVAFLRLIVTRF